MASIFKNKLIRIRESARTVIYRGGFNSLATRSRAQLLALKGKYAGRRAFIIGNGPSLNRQNLNLMKDEVTFACNSFFLKHADLAYRPSYYVVEDVLVAEDNARELSELDCSQKLIPWDLRKWIQPDEHTTYLNFKRYYAEDTDPAFPQFSFDAQHELYWGGTVLYLCIQLAAYMGFTSIYLIGVDLSYRIPDDIQQNGAKLTSHSDDPNHFHPAYFGAGKRWHIPEPERMGRCFHHAWEVLSARNIALINATDGGNLNSIPRANYSELFASV